MVLQPIISTIIKAFGILKTAQEPRTFTKRGTTMRNWVYWYINSIQHITNKIARWTTKAPSRQPHQATTHTSSSAHSNVTLPPFLVPSKHNSIDHLCYMQRIGILWKVHEYDMYTPAAEWEESKFAEHDIVVLSCPSKTHLIHIHESPSESKSHQNKMSTNSKATKTTKRKQPKRLTIPHSHNPSLLNLTPSTITHTKTQCPLHPS